MIRLPAWPFGRARAETFDYTAPIIFRGVTKRFGSRIALDNFDVVIPAGRVTALVGPDGAGKSTILRLIAGSLVPTAGQIVVGGLDVVRRAGDVQAHLGFVPSRRLLYGDLTIAENLAFFAGLYPAEPVAMAERRASLLDLMDLAQFSDRFAGNLSGGMRQKLALACALQHNPGVLLMDEPTTGIDPLARRDLWRLFHRLNRDGLTVLLSTPAMDEATRCHEVIFMDRGRQMARGSPATLLEHAHGRVLALDATPVALATSVARRFPEVSSVQPRGDRLHILLDADASADPSWLKSRLQSHGVTVRSIEPVRPSLEDVFVALTTSARAQSKEA